MFATLSLLVIGAGPSPLTLPTANYRLGDEMVYTGEWHEECRRIDLTYKRSHAVEIRVFVLNRNDHVTDLAVMTSLLTKEDPVIAQAAATVTGRTSPTPHRPAVQLEFARITAAGAMHQLLPKPSLPLVFDEKTETRPLRPVALDAPTRSELGFYIPRGEDHSSLPIHWWPGDTTLRNGTQVRTIHGDAQSRTWANPSGTDTSYRRSETHLVAVSDGITRQWTRTIERKDGRDRTESRTLSLEMTTPPTLNRGEGYLSIRREIEAAYAFLAEYDCGRTIRLAERIDAFAQRHRETPYRAALEAVRRRCK